LDLNVYHKMLRGAVTFNEDFERHYMKEIFQLEKGMTQAISHFSRYVDASVLDEPGRTYAYQGDRKGSALVKIRWFYRFSIGMLVAVGLALFLATAHFGSPRSGQKQSTEKVRQNSQSKPVEHPASAVAPPPVPSAPLDTQKTVPVNPASSAAPPATEPQQSPGAANISPTPTPNAEDKKDQPSAK
jgi:hypothetical protein